MKILTDLYDIKGNLVAPKGIRVTRSLVRELIRKGAEQRKERVSLAQPFLIRDVRAIMNEETCRPIFNEPALQRTLIRMVRSIRIARSLYQEIIPMRHSSTYNYRHFILIGLLSARMALDLGMSYAACRKAFLFGFVHDIGKTRIPENILNKKTLLTRAEYRLLRTHPIKSYFLLHYYMGKEGTEAAEVGFTHHEKLDGSGYPRGIRQMSLYAKLVAVNDIFDALVANRPYRKRPFTIRSALDRLIADMDDGMLPGFPVRLLISYYRRKKEDFKTLKLSRHPREPEPEGNLYGKIAKE